MRRINRKTFAELVQENKRQLLADQEAVARLEDRVEARVENRFRQVK